MPICVQQTLKFNSSVRVNLTLTLARSSMKTLLGLANSEADTDAVFISAANSIKLHRKMKHLYDIKTI